MNLLMNGSPKVINPIFILLSSAQSMHYFRFFLFEDPSGFLETDLYINLIRDLFMYIKVLPL